jgi:hypothetical protein
MAAKNVTKDSARCVSKGRGLSEFKQFIKEIWLRPKSPNGATE